MLRDGFPAELYHLGKELLRDEQGGAHVVAHFADGSRADALAKGIGGAAGAVAVQQITVRTYPATGKVFCGEQS